MNTDLHFSSATGEWETPRDFFDRLAEEFGPFDLDPAATPATAKAGAYFTKFDDGLKQDWAPYKKIYVNPPYGRGIRAWVQRAVLAAHRGSLVVMLLPARTDTSWWHDYVMPHGEVRFLRGRLRFGGAANAAPFPSAVVIFGRRA